MKPDERVHDLDERRLARPVADGASRTNDRAHLHLVDLGKLEPEAAATRPEHRIRLLELPDPVAHRIGGRLLERRQELVEGRIEQADGHRQAGHRLEDPLEVALLHRKQPVECAASLLLVAGEDHLADDRQPILRHEHVLRPTEADSLRAELSRLRRVRRRVRVGAHLEPPELVGPAEDRAEVLVDRRRDERHRADDHLARAAVDRDQVPDGELVLAELDRLRLQVDRERFAADDARRPLSTRDHGRMRGHSAVRREDALRLVHSGVVVRSRLPADENDRLSGFPLLLGRFRVKHDRADRRSGRRVQARRGDLERLAPVDHRVQQLVELPGVDPRDGFLARDEALVDHLCGDTQSRRRRPLARARLQEVERPLLDRELDVLEVAVVGLEAVERVDELVERLRHALAHALDRLGRPNACDHVLALRIREKLAVQPSLSRRRVAREAHAGAGGLAAVPEDHLDDVHRRSEIVRDVVRGPVHLGTRRVPRVEDGAVRTSQLVARLLRERARCLVRVDRGERCHELAEVVGGEVDVLGHSPRRLQIGERLLEAMAVDLVDHLAVHLDEPPVRVERKPRVPGGRRQALDGDVVQAEVEDRVHHPRHRDRRAGANGDEQRVAIVAEALAGPRLECRDALVDLLVEPGRNVSAGCEVGTARLGGDREPVRNGHAECGHLGEADPLPPEELTAAARAFGEVEDVAHLRGESTRPRREAGRRIVARLPAS